jgi:DNA-directed RNA polymerase
LSEAKDKFLFLSFCFEYKRYISFINDENALEFHTYLPIQLDATCNGFQHMALLSNEKILFKELNLIVDNNNEVPKDFYNFLIHKLIVILESYINMGTLLDSNGGSYERLLKFGLTRSDIKKAIMTIPYNVSPLNMRKYIKSNLHVVESETKDNLT